MDDHGWKAMMPWMIKNENHDVMDDQGLKIIMSWMIKDEGIRCKRYSWMKSHDAIDDHG